MKLNLSCRIMLVCFVLLTIVNPAAAQNVPSSANSAQPNQISEPMGEDDRLPFMRDERGDGNINESSSGGMLIRTLGGLMLIIGLIFCGAWGIKKFGAKFGLLPAENAVRADAPEMSVLHSVGLGNGRTLAVVRFGERNLLIGSTAHSFTLLADETNYKTNSSGATLLKQNRSVADLLAEENSSFAQELNAADSRLNLFNREQM